MWFLPWSKPCTECPQTTTQIEPVLFKLWVAGVLSQQRSVTNTARTRDSNAQCPMGSHLGVHLGVTRRAWAVLGLDLTSRGPARLGAKILIAPSLVLESCFLIPSLMCPTWQHLVSVWMGWCQSSAQISSVVDQDWQQCFSNLLIGRASWSSWSLHPQPASSVSSDGTPMSPWPWASTNFYIPLKR